MKLFAAQLTAAKAAVDQSNDMPRAEAPGLEPDASRDVAKMKAFMICAFEQGFVVAGLKGGSSMHLGS